MKRSSHTTKARIPLAITGAALLALVVAGCTAPGGAAGGDGAPLDKVSVSGSIPVATLDATEAGEDASLLAIYLGQGQLFRFDNDRQPVPDLAESADISEDGLEVTITLRDGLTYSDGSPVTAEDIKTAFDRQIDGGIGASYFSTMESVEVVDDSVAILHMKSADPDVLMWLTGRALPINPTALVEDDPDYFLHPVSAGPYVVDGWVPGDTVATLKENPNYWAGPMMTKEVDIVGVPDISSLVLQVSSGDIDYAWDIPAASLSSLPDNVNVFTGPNGGYNYLAVNMGKDNAFSDPRVREAMSLAIDRQAIADQAFQGMVPVATSFMYSCGELCEPDLLPNAGVQDIEAAKQLLADAGYAGGIDGGTMMVTGTRPGWADAAVLISEQLAEIGITYEVVPTDDATWVEAFENNTFDAVFAGGAAPAQAALQQVFADDGWWAMGVGYKNAETTELVAEAGRTLDPAERRAIFTQIQKIGQETMPMITVVERTSIIASTTPEGLLARPTNTGLINVQTVQQAEDGLGAGEH